MFKILSLSLLALLAISCDDSTDTSNSIDQGFILTQGYWHAGYNPCAGIGPDEECTPIEPSAINGTYLIAAKDTTVEECDIYSSITFSKELKSDTLGLSPGQWCVFYQYQCIDEDQEPCEKIAGTCKSDNCIEVEPNSWKYPNLDIYAP